LPIPAAISLTGTLAARPSAITIRSSWVKKRDEIGRGSGMITLPASMNHSDPQLVDTPTRRAASAPLRPERINTKYRRFTDTGILCAQRGIRTSSHRTFATIPRHQGVYPVLLIDAIVRHEAPHVRGEVGDLSRWVVAAARPKLRAA
jgi:hypothetical protein